MPDVSDDFARYVNDTQEKVDDAEMRDGWSPPRSPGGIYYNCLLRKVIGRGGFNKKTDQPYASTALVWLVEDGDHKGRSFVTSFTTDIAFKMGPMFSLAAILTGDPSYEETPHNQEKATLAIGQFEGKAWMEVIAKEDTNRNTGEKYPAWAFGRRINVVVDPGPPITSPADTPPSDPLTDIHAKGAGAV